MIKKTIKFKDFDGNEVTEDHYFHLTKAEAVELEVSEKSGFMDMLLEVIKEEDGKKIIEIFKKIILMSYGKKSEDGRRFIKSEEMKTEFSQSLAFEELFVELATNHEAAAAFVNGIVPGDLKPSSDEKPAIEQPDGSTEQEVTEKALTEMSKEELIAHFQEKQKAIQEGSG
jgi:hypothetical protein